ncbi:MAG: hypothetical protein DMG08_17640 [Acidobacteria bacterium]|nr:MAG: hypothetical protein DMG08_17640 [Acidobacteriota bacterium]
MTQKEIGQRFERIETQLEILARYNVSTAARVDELFEAQKRTEASLVRLTERTETGFARLTDALTSLVRIVERRVSDDHGPK